MTPLNCYLVAVDAAEVYRRGCAAWPELNLPHERFVELMAEPALVGTGMASSIDPAEVVLAAACAIGDSVALQIFDRAYVAPHRAAACRGLGGDDQAAQDVLQQVRCSLLITADGEAPSQECACRIPLLKYAGQGRLHGLVRTIVQRMCTKVRNGGAATVPVGTFEKLSGVLDATLQIKNPTSTQIDRQATKLAVEHAWAALDKEQRLLLQLHHIKGLPVRRLGAIYGIHPATAARRVAGARLAFAHQLRSALQIFDPDRAQALRPDFESRLSLSFLRLGMDEKLPGVVTVPSS